MTAEVLPALLNPKQHPDWTFSFFVPGHPMPKGSPITRTVFIAGRRRTQVRDKIEVMAWVAKAAGIAKQKRMRLEAQGNKSFPYLGAVSLSAVFTFQRPRTQPPPALPIISSGPKTKEGIRSAVGDLDKLVRAVGDALGFGDFSVDDNGKARASRAGVLKDDNLITDFEHGPYKRFVDQVPGSEPGCYLKLAPARTININLALFV